jgi:hypothetical protein
MILLALYLHHVQYHSLTPQSVNPSQNSPNYSWQSPGWSEGTNMSMEPRPMPNSGSGGVVTKQPDTRFLEEL